MSHSLSLRAVLSTSQGLQKAEDAPVWWERQVLRKETYDRSVTDPMGLLGEETAGWMGNKYPRMKVSHLLGGPEI